MLERREGGNTMSEAMPSSGETSHTYHSAREAPVHEDVVPLGGATEGRLEIRGGMARLRPQAAPGSADVLRSRFTGARPSIIASGGDVTLHTRFELEDLFRVIFSSLDSCAGELWLTDAVPWKVGLRGGARDLEADLRGLRLGGLDLRG